MFRDGECVSKTYAIHAVIDAKTLARKTFSEAVTLGLIDPQTGTYCNRSTGEQVYVGNAIRRGLIKATVVHDSNALGVAPANDAALSLSDAAESHQNGMSNGGAHNK